VKNNATLFFLGPNCLVGTSIDINNGISINNITKEDTSIFSPEQGTHMSGTISIKNHDNFLLMAELLDQTPFMLFFKTFHDYSKTQHDLCLVSIMGHI
jgi:hypothetical protein